MEIEILSIGNEVLEGDTINTNAAFLSRELTAAGYTVKRHTVLPDEPEAILGGFKEALERSKRVIATGGTGPTLDDLTRQSIEPLFKKETKQLVNHVGTAPGWVFFSKAWGTAILLPGPPQEMEQMFRSGALAYLKEHSPPPSAFTTLELSLCQVREIDLDPFLRKLHQQHPDAFIGIYPSLSGVKIRFRLQERTERLQEWEELIRSRFKTHWYEGSSLQEAVVKELLRQGKTLALAESCTGGALAARLVSVPDVSKVFSGSIVTYSNEWKERLLGVSPITLKEHGAVSAETAREMVEGLFERADADFALAITGIAGPSGGSLDKPVGTVHFAFGERGKSVDLGKIQAAPPRDHIIETSLQIALGAIFRRLAYGITPFL